MHFPRYTLAMNTNYKLIYANRKSISMRIDENGQLIVRAPHFTSKAEIEKIINKHKSQLEKMQKNALAKEKAISEIDKAELEVKLKNIVLPLVEKYSKEMGVSPENVKFTNAKKRFGSCNSKKTICFSRYLALYPEAAIEYVVVHEMAHLFEMNHSPRFYAVVEKYLPDWRDRKKLLVLKL